MALIMVVALLVTAALVVAACGTTEETTTTVALATTTTAASATTSAAGETTTTGVATVEIKKIAVMVPEEANDFGWNQGHAEAGETFAAEIGAEYVLADGLGYDDPGAALRQLVADGADWIMATIDGSETVAPQVAQRENIYANIIGEFGAGNLPGFVTDFETRAYDGGYLAGIVAAMMTKTGTIAAVMSADDENWTMMTGGLIAAARAVNPDIKVLLAQVGPFAYGDAPAAKRTTDSAIAAGADVIFGMGDGSSFGMIQACETATPPSGADKVWFIDVIGDKTSLDTKGIYLSSVVWDYLPAWREAYAALQAGTFGNEVVYIGLHNDGIGILKTQHIPDDVWAEVEKAKQEIIDGTIQVPQLSLTSELEELLAK